MVLYFRPTSAMCETNWHSWCSEAGTEENQHLSRSPHNVSSLNYRNGERTLLDHGVNSAPQLCPSCWHPVGLGQDKKVQQLRRDAGWGSMNLRVELTEERDVISGKRISQQILPAFNMSRDQVKFELCHNERTLQQMHTLLFFAVALIDHCYQCRIIILY